MSPNASLTLVIGFIGLPILMGVGGVLAARRTGTDAALRSGRQMTAVVVAWLGISAGLALLGITQRFDSVPPPALPIVGAIILSAVVVGVSRLGGRLASLPLRLLVGFQAFRILVELLIHQAVVEGVAPPQLTWSGRNLDIIVGVLAVPGAVWADRLPKAALWAFNLIGVGLLLNVVIVAILSVPTPFQVFKPDNTWVGFFPFIWLPAGLVTFALLGHVVLTRRLLQRT